MIFQLSESPPKAAEETEMNGIHDQFPENKFRLFRSFCRKKDLSFVEEITPAGLEEFRSFPQVAKGSFRQ
ncbi:hypothetical protein [Siminovitchia fordii]|uniref:hypothetical protein n=1 Tax=Siminovitchia fordii TaxID=254759 RepID=UPI001BB3962C|nr:hypothetical protein [Siminovitchia fordii]